MILKIVSTIIAGLAFGALLALTYKQIRKELTPSDYKLWWFFYWVTAISFFALFLWAIDAWA